MGRLTDDAIVRALKALADPTRFRMVQLISDAGELSCGQVAERLELAQPTNSHHIKILTEAGVLVGRTAGKHHILSVNAALVRQLGENLTQRVARGTHRRM